VLSECGLQCRRQFRGQVGIRGPGVALRRGQRMLSLGWSFLGSRERSCNLKGMDNE
jgi:hypothetical protein